jgi:capsule biosynthesis phosphatase
MKNIIIDLDNTLTIECTEAEGGYSKKLANVSVVDACRKYREMGFKVIISTSRNMRTYNGNIGKINIHTLPKIIQWLDENEVPYDEIYVGKPWCGFEGFYVDDKAIRPSEFASMSYEEIIKLLDKENKNSMES